MKREEKKEENDLNSIQLSKIKESVEIRLYLQTIYLIYLVNKKELSLGEILSEKIIKQVKELNYRHLDNLNAHIYFYYFRIQELSDKMKQSRPLLMEVYRNSCVHNDQVTQATLINLILRNYLHFKQIDQANHFNNKINFPSTQQN